MKTVFFVLALACLSGSPALADISADDAGPATPPHAAAPAAPGESPAPVAMPGPGATSAASPTGAVTDPAKIAEFEQRFAQGKALEDEGKLLEARNVFDGILAEAPDAKGSLREAGLISVELNELTKANDYFDRLHALVPDYPMAIEALIQVNQSLKRDAKVEILIKQFKALYAAGKVPKPYFVRERMHFGDGEEIAITQFFDYHQPAYYAWAADLFDKTHTMKRRLTVNYDPEVTQSIREKDPKLANAEQFLLVDNVMTDGQITRLDVYQQFLALPDYAKMRDVMLGVFVNALKPIDSAPVPAKTE